MSDTPKTYESDTPETCEAVERWQDGLRGETGQIGVFTARYGSLVLVTHGRG